MSEREDWHPKPQNMEASPVTKMEQLAALRDRLAKATGPDRELDGALALATGHDASYRVEGVVRPQEPRFAHLWSLPYTASIDAAVTLVPSGCEWLRKSVGVMTIYRFPTREDGWGKHFDAAGATPALALCLARLEYELAKEQP